MMCEKPRVKKVIPLKMSLKFVSLFSVLFGVYSVSFEAHSYPVSKFNSSTSSSPSTAPAPSQSLKLTRSAPSRAQAVATRGPLAPGTHNLSLGVGQVFLLGRLGDNHQNAIGTQLTYTYGVSDLFAFESNFGYSSHSNTDLSLTYLSAGLRTNLVYFDQLVPFLNLGLGFYRPSETVATDVSLNALLFGLQLGGGIDLLISEKVFFGTRLAFHDMFSSSKQASNGQSYDLGGSFMSFLIHAGINF